MNQPWTSTLTVPEAPPVCPSQFQIGFISFLRLVLKLGHCPKTLTLTFNPSVAPRLKPLSSPDPDAPQALNPCKPHLELQTPVPHTLSVGPALLRVDPEPIQVLRPSREGRHTGGGVLRQGSTRFIVRARSAEKNPTLTASPSNRVFWFVVKGVTAHLLACVCSQPTAGQQPTYACRSESVWDSRLCVCSKWCADSNTQPGPWLKFHVNQDVLVTAGEGLSKQLLTPHSSPPETEHQHM